MNDNVKIDLISTERTRIRSALLAAIESNTVYVRWIGNHGLPVEDPYILVSDIHESIDEICPVEDVRE